jgi:DNA-binding beta-propeller fold protein YncE
MSIGEKVPRVRFVCFGLVLVVVWGVVACLDQPFDNPSDEQREQGFQRYAYLDATGPIVVRSSLTWVLDAFRGSVLLFDNATGTLQQTLDLRGMNAAGMASEKDSLWLSDSTTREVLRINPFSGQRERTLLLPVLQPEALAYRESTGTLYVFDRGRSEVLEILSEQNRISRAIPLEGLTPADMTVRENYLLLLDDVSRKLHSLDLESATILRTEALSTLAAGVDAEEEYLFLLGRDGWLYRGP